MNVNARLEAVSACQGQPLSLGLLVEVAGPQLPEQIQTRTPQGVVFVIDRSGSMGNGRLDLVKQSIGDLVGRLSPTDYLAIISFDYAIEVHIPMQPVGSLKAADIRRNLAELSPRGGTNIELGYRHGLAEAAKAPSGVETKLVLLSDGQANNGEKDPQVLAQLAAQATEHLVSTATLGIGTGYNELLMSAIAESGHGNHFAAVNIDEALAGLQDEIDGLLSRSLVNINATIAGVNMSLQGVNPIGYVRSKENTGRALRIGEPAKLGLGELASGEERGFAFMVDFGEVPTDPEFGQILLKVRVTAESALDGTPVEFEQQLRVSIETPENFVEPVRDEDVVAEIAAYRIQEVKRVAARLAEQGRMQEAREMLTGAQLGNTQMLEDFESLSPRVRARLLAEREELEALMSAEGPAFSKRAFESMHRGERSKRDPRQK